MRTWLLILLVTAAGCRHHAAPFTPSLPSAPPSHLDAETVPEPLPTREVPPSARSGVEELAPKLPRAPFEVLVREANRKLQDAFFAYDRADLSDESLSALQRDAALVSPLLADAPDLRLVVEGHCDERGPAAYNLALGDRRASRAADVLRQFGVPESRLLPISYGKERPQCEEAAEACWRRNRRAHLELR